MLIETLFGFWPAIFRADRSYHPNLLIVVYISSWSFVSVFFSPRYVLKCIYATEMQKMRIFTKYFVFNLGSRVEGWRRFHNFYKTKYLSKKFESPLPSGRCWTPRINIGVVGKVRSMLHAVVKLPARTP